MGLAILVGERGRMPQRPRDEEREERIRMEIVVDAYGPEEQAIRELLSTVPGFRAYYAARTGAGDAVATVTLCDDQAGTAESTRRAGEWVRANVAGASVAPTDVTEGETYINF
jgi:hypothetical protein